MRKRGSKPSEGKSYIYSLTDPLTGQVRYIGRTICSLNQRYNGHRENSKIDKTHKIDWMKSLFNKGLEPIIELVDIVNRDEQNYWELFYIGLFRGWGFDLTNGVSENDGTWFSTETTRRKVSEALTGRKHSEERNKQKSILFQKILRTPEHRSKMSEVMRRIYSNPENILKMVISKGGKEFKVFKIEKNGNKTYLFNRINKTHCAKELGIKNPVCIRRVLNKERQYTSNYYFEYV